MLYCQLQDRNAIQRRSAGPVHVSGRCG